MSQVQFQYKCRQCGVVEGAAVTNATNALAILQWLFDDGAMPQLLGPMPQVVEFHDCENGGRGISDLTGYKPYV